jgi:hypothetical protein
VGKKFPVTSIITIRGYQKRADFYDQFTHEQQAIARRIFLRLTRLGDESRSGDTRRRARFDELSLPAEETATTTRRINFGVSQFPGYQCHLGRLPWNRDFSPLNEIWSSQEHLGAITLNPSIPWAQVLMVFLDEVRK